MPTITEREQQKKTSPSDIVVSLVLHAAVIGGLLGAGLFHKHGENWGDRLDQASSISATMVNSLPLPPRQPVDEKSVLASETPSPAPIQQKETVEPPPSPKDIPILTKKPEKKPPPPKPQQVPQQAVLRPQPVKPQPDRAQTGESSGIRVAMQAVQTRSGTVSMAMNDSTFGQRYAYYVSAMKNKISQQWYTGVLDPGARGRRVYMTYRIERDGTPSQVQIARSSGDPTLDSSALRALQHIDTFGPLPEGYSGSYLDVQFYFEPPQ